MDMIERDDIDVESVLLQVVFEYEYLLVDLGSCDCFEDCIL